MKRRTLDLTLATVGLVVALVMAIAGGLLLFAANFASDTVSSELSAQQIFFPPAAQLSPTQPRIAAVRWPAGHHGSPREVLFGHDR